MPENKNKLIALVIIVVIGLGTLFYVVWGILLNKGTVIFLGNPPYTVSIGDEERECMQTECEFVLQSDDYTYHIRKEGFYVQSGFVEVERGSNIPIETNLEYIAEVLEGEEYQIFLLPLGYSKFKDSLLDITLFNDFDLSHQLKKLPKKIENIIFSGSGEHALVIEKDDVSIYDTRDFTIKSLEDIKDALDVAWADDETILYTISFDDEANKDALKKVYLTDDKPTESLIYFIRDIDEYQLLVPFDEHYVAVADTTFKPEILYIIDLQEEKRTNIFEGYVIGMGVWAPDSSVFVFSGKHPDENKSVLWYWSSATKEVEKLPFKGDIKNIDFNSKGIGYFVTTQPYDLIGSTPPYGVNFIEEEEVIDYTEILEGEEELKNIGLHKWMDGQYYLVKDLTGVIEKVPDKIEVSDDNSLLRLLIDGLVFDIVLTK